MAKKDKLSEQLKEQLEEIFFISPDAAPSLRICNEDVLKRLWPEDYEMVVNRDRDVRVRLMEILKYLSAVRLVGALDSLDENGARGFVTFWYSFLEPPMSQRQIPSLQQVLRYAASHTSDLSQTVVDLLKRSKRFQQNTRVQNILSISLISQKLQKLFRELRGPGNEVVEKMPTSTRRNWANYLLSATNTIAHEIYAVAPEVFVTGREKLLTEQAPARGDHSASLLVQAETYSLEPTALLAEPDNKKVDQLAQVQPHQLERLILDLLDERAHFREEDEEDDQQEGFRTSSTPDPDWIRKWLATCLDEIASYTMDVCSHHNFAFGIELPIEIQVGRELVLEGRGEAAKVISGKHIPDPLKGRVALLSAQPGSGRTSVLRSWAYRSASEWLTSTSTRLPFYISARQFRDYAVNNFNIYRCITDYVFPEVTLEEAGILRGVLEVLDRTDHLLIIVDDLDRLTQADQNQMMDKLLFSKSVIYATIPSDAISIRSKLPEYKGPLSITFKNLGQSAQMELLSKVSAWHLEHDCDLTLGKYVLQEVPYLVESPLGVLAVYSQLVKHQTTRSEVIDSYIQEMLRRAGLPTCDFARGVHSNDPIVSSLLTAARAIAINLGSEYPESSLHSTLGTSPEQFAYIETLISRRPHWDLLWPTRLFMTRGETDNKEKALWFCNWDVLCYLGAIDNEFHIRSLGKEHEIRQSVILPRLQMRAYFNEHWEKHGEKEFRMRTV